MFRFFRKLKKPDEAMLEINLGFIKLSLKWVRKSP